MKFTCKQQLLARALNIVGRAINNNNTLPVLNNILVEAKENQLELSATNLEIAIKMQIPAEVSEAGSITIPAKIFTSYIQLLQQKSIDISLTRDLSVEINNQGDYTKIKGLPAADFPQIPVIEPEAEIEVTESDLAQGLQLTAFAASLHSSRPVLAGVYLSIKANEMIFAATDSYRLAEKKLALKDNQIEFECVLPVRSAHEIAKLLQSDSKKPVKIKLSKNQIELTNGDLTFISRLIEGKYPDYTKIIPEGEKTKVTLSREELDNALKKVSIFTREINNNMKLTILEDQLRLISNETKIGEGEATVKIKKAGEDNEIAVNSQFLQDVVSLLSDKELEIIVNDKHLPVLVKTEKNNDYLYFIMPLKV